MRCRPGMECKTNISVQQGAYPGGALVCSEHGKPRSGQSLMDNGRGGMRCRDGMECKTSGGGSLGGSFSGGSGLGTGQLMCSEHGKPRSMQSLVDDGKGGFRCSPGMECKTANTGTVCTLHGKMRSPEVLTSDGQGGFKCIDGKECKVGSGQSMKREVCRFWQQGLCSKGAGCGFLHEGEAGAEVAAAMAIGMGMPIGMGAGMPGMGNMMGIGMAMGMGGMPIGGLTVAGDAACVSSWGQSGWHGNWQSSWPDGSSHVMSGKGANRLGFGYGFGQGMLPSGLGIQSTGQEAAGAVRLNWGGPQQSHAEQSWQSDADRGWQDKAEWSWQGSASRSWQDGPGQGPQEPGPVRKKLWASERSSPY